MDQNSVLRLSPKSIGLTSMDEVSINCEHKLFTSVMFAGKVCILISYYSRLAWYSFL